MNITFDGAEKTARTHSNVDRDTTVYRGSESTGTVQRSIFALDISGTVMDNNAYAGHGRTAEEVMQDAAQQDITARRNYMAVMSNSLSDEDFAKLQKDGFHPGSTDIETVVTIVDHIKTAMMKGGTHVAGYTDSMDAAQLKEITGSAAFAGELEQAFTEQDIPVTRENAEAVKKAYEVTESVGQLSDGAKKYLIENHLKLTPENLYTARFAGAADASRQGKGYYAAGDVGGYLAKKPENIDYEQLMPAIEKTILQAGLSVGEDTLADAKWLIEKGIPLSEETLLQKQAIDGFTLPMPMQEFAKAAAIAIADGKDPMKGDLTAKQSVIEQAVSLKEQIDTVTDMQVEVIHTSDLPFTLRNLILAEAGQENRFYAGSESGLKKNAGQPVTGQQVGQPEITENPALKEKVRLLHEVRLSMTVNVNVRLLKKGYSIDTLPMEDLLKAIRSEENIYHQQLVQDTEPKAAAEKAGFYQQTLFELERIKSAPLATVADISVKSTLQEVSVLAGIRTADYQKAGKSYEALWTAPRADLGDSIKKAFANVDEILADLGQEASEENRRAVRILGYNSMEMTHKHFEEVKQADGLLRDVVGKMNPAEVLNMIRQGINPLSMQLTELKEYLDGRATVEEEMESYSRFLYRLEKKNGVTEEERSAFIGIYRLLRQIEKKDDAAIGAVLQTGTEMTLSNLLSFVRSSSRKSMDYQIDDSFGGVDAKEGLLKSITEQIKKGFVENRADLEQALADEETAEIDQQYDKETYETVRLAMRSEDAVLRQLRDYGQSVSAEHLLAAGEMLKGSSEIFRKLRKIADEREEETLFEEDTFPEKLTGKEETLKNYDEMADKVLKMLEAESFEGEYSSVDIKGISALYKQITFCKSMAKEENYEIPVEIGGNLTAVNLKMIHKESGESKVTITMETQRLGRTAAEFTFLGERLTGYGICDSAEGKALLSEGKARFEQLLLREGIEAGDIRFMENTKLDLKEFSLKAEDGRISAPTSDQFYQAAKAYIGYIQEISK